MKVIPVFQTKFRHPDGNCVPACIASILELPLSEVPELEYDRRDWFCRYRDRLLSVGIQLSLYCEPRELSGYYIKTIVTRYGEDAYSAHAVVCHNGVVVHDPHPEQPHRILAEHGRYYFKVERTATQPA